MVSLSSLGNGLGHPECVAWDPVSGLLACGSEGGELIWLDLDGAERRRVRVSDGMLAGIAIDATGTAYVCDVAGRRVARVTPDGAVATLTTGPADRPFTTPNYPVLDGAGRLFVSDSGTWGRRDGSIVAVDPDGTARSWSTEPAGYTNGLALDPAGTALLAVESTLPGVSRIPILADGSAGPREVLVELPRTVPDGLAFAADGTLLISCYRPDVVRTWKDGILRTLAEDWSGIQLSAPTNVAFAGPALDVLVAANLGGHALTRLDGSGLTGAPLGR
ncbi:MAG: SMP-30/gluconolactonase/LRE family protein [Chloroflexota bacterium]